MPTKSVSLLKVTGYLRDRATCGHSKRNVWLPRFFLTARSQKWFLFQHMCSIRLTCSSMSGYIRIPGVVCTHDVQFTVKVAKWDSRRQSQRRCIFIEVRCSCKVSPFVYSVCPDKISYIVAYTSHLYGQCIRAVSWGRREVKHPKCPYS